ncbi:MAG: DUF2442 domain-containing protein [Bacteroidota bacterium]
MKITEQYTEQQKQESLSIIKANYIGDFAIRLFFNDGHQRLVDFKPFLEQATHPAIKKYLDEKLFRTYQIKDGNLDWNDFDLCFPLEDLYQNRLLKNEEATINAN